MHVRKKLIAYLKVSGKFTGTENIAKNSTSWITAMLTNHVLRKKGTEKKGQKQACDSRDREKLYSVLLSRAKTDHARRRVRILEKSKRIANVTGIEARGLAPMLFNLALESVVRKIPVHINSALLNKSNK